MTFFSFVGVFVLYFCATSVAQKIFECDPLFPNMVSIDGTKFDCPAGKMCNRFAQDEQTEPPCVENEKLCKERFTCSDNITVKFTKINFEAKCPDNKICNKKYNLPCKECICGGFSCLSEDEKMVDIHGLGFPYKCPSGQVCNRLSVLPCNPCIKK